MDQYTQALATYCVGLQALIMLGMHLNVYVNSSSLFAVDQIAVVSNCLCIRGSSKENEEQTLQFQLPLQYMDASFLPRPS